MAIRIEPFGRLASGVEIEQIELEGQGLKLCVLTWGAVIRDLRVSIGEITERRVVLGLDRIEHYVEHSPYFGAIAGRYANRIANACFEIDGRSWQLDRNFRNRHHLHGGAGGFSQRPWQIVESGPEFVTLRLDSPDGDQGYPGSVGVECTYRLLEPATLETELRATTTATTPINLAQHSYFNLDETPTIRRHRLQIVADSWLPIDDDLIPSGEVRPVEATRFDFREPRAIFSSGQVSDGYDHNFVIDRFRRAEPALVARLIGERGLSLEIDSTEPGLQFYDGAGIDVPVAGLGGRDYRRHAGLCLEPQNWPDAPNHAHFPDPLLRPGEVYRQVTRFRFVPSAG